MRLQPLDKLLEKTIINLLECRGTGASICPSEAIRALEAQGLVHEWRDYMEQTRRAARRLVLKNQIVITQQGKVVDPSRAKGPIRLRRRNYPSETNA